jgi:hypothetical protein
MTQIDAEGDVVITDTIFIPPGDIAEGWWGNPQIHAGRPLENLEVGAYPQPANLELATSAVVALSNGRLAYATYSTSSREVIDLRNLATNSTRTIVRFPGSAGVLGIALNGSRLAWAQQSLGYTTPTTADPCVTQTHALGPVQLIHTSTHTSTPIIEAGDPVAPPTGPLCPPPP